MAIPPPQRLVIGLASFLLITLAAYAENPEAIRFYNQGIEYYTKGNNAQALQLFEKAAKADPKYSDAFYNIGSVYYQLKQYPKAKEAFQRALALSPKDGQAKYNLALTWERLGNPAEGVRILRQIPSGDAKYSKAQAKIVLFEQKIKANATTQTTPKPAVQAEKKPTQVATLVPEKKPERVAQDALLDGPGTPEEAKYSLQTFANGFFGPTGMALGPDGSLYVANYSKNAIYKVSRQGETDVWVKGDGLNGPIGMTYDAKSDAFYVANYLQGNIVKITSMGEVSVLVSGLNKPYNLLLDRDHRTLYVSEQETNTVSKIELER